ncbi:DegT/DnrJ/EryC1/StrS family aminotransferase [Andreprevotia chitinilytica]|uniref:DegT/DnrJ/EryC1/StrS family aminotransferase n=1 Tax=Andreprevotia chitinilytica TaxID=396808 RepID=UPI0005541FED|nr:DegT/DnrJ/EryC1/StrS family aminotransferase [Andreprevotia chitinilytica]
MSAIRLIKPYISFEDVEAEFRDVFESGMFTRGQHVEALRQELAAYTGAKHAFLVTSATTALWVCMKLLGVGPGDEVIVSDFSFPATANVVEDLGARPVFADVSLDTFNMLPEDLEKKISPRTKAVIFVDALGNPTGLTEIKSICQRHGIPLVEDAACAIGSGEHQRRCGAIADLTCFSFHPRKLLTTGEGGAITTDRDEWAYWLEAKLAHGARGMKGPGLDFVDYGYNFRLSELQAVMGRKQLARLEQIVDERNEIRVAYEALLRPLGFKIQKLGASVRHNVQSMVFHVPEGCNRDALVAALKLCDIETTIGTYAMSATTFYAERYRDIQPNSQQLNDCTITLPCYHGVDVARVAHEITRITKA